MPAHSRIVSAPCCPRTSAVFHQAQQQTGVEWRLVAAIAYQESHWDPRGDQRNERPRHDDAHRGHREAAARCRPPRSAAEHHRRRALPCRPETKPAATNPEPDRTWIALAAFNIGIGHLEDARVLAARQKLNPNSWSDLKKTLPLLAQTDLADQTKYGAGPRRPGRRFCRDGARVLRRAVAPGEALLRRPAAGGAIAIPWQTRGTPVNVCRRAREGRAKFPRLRRSACCHQGYRNECSVITDPYRQRTQKRLDGPGAPRYLVRPCDTFGMVGNR